MADYNFEAEKEAGKIVDFIKGFFEQRPAFKGVVIGISGGKDSAVAAALCVRALGAERVFGVLLPNGVQVDIDDSTFVCKSLGIEYMELNIAGAVEQCAGLHDFSELAKQNICPRIRMTLLYAVAQSRGMLVVCNSNLSEFTVGYTTKWGDCAGDFAPLLHLTKTEVVAVGRALGLCARIVDKPPQDGLCGKSDEENLGFTYQALDLFIRGGKVEPAVADKIRRRIDENAHKRLPIPTVI